uniref:BHLH domain-containing protein n=1 Tax=Steinernema glaseri TaxID=37863 RepID=A0A1I8ANX8_9BILA
MHGDKSSACPLSVLRERRHRRTLIETVLDSVKSVFANCGDRRPPLLRTAGHRERPAACAAGSPVFVRAPLVLAYHPPRFPSFQTTCGSQMSLKLSDGSSQRKANKPLMEKRRRARINRCLNELKQIIMEKSREQTAASHTKWEKADILEMTLAYIKSLQEMTISGKDTVPWKGQIVGDGTDGHQGSEFQRFSTSSSVTAPFFDNKELN